MDPLPEKVTIGTLVERIEGIVRLQQERHNNVTEQISDLEEDFETFETKVDKEIEETNEKIGALELHISEKFGALELAAVTAERRIQTENEKNRISRNRWMIGTVLTVATAALGLIVDLLKG